MNTPQDIACTITLVAADHTGDFVGRAVGGFLILAITVCVMVALTKGL